MPKNKIIPYNPKLKEYAQQLRKNSTLAEVLLWNKIKNRALGVQFHRQVPLLNFIVDFYCHEMLLAIEIDGDSHDFKYQYDEKRQGLLEKEGVQFLRFSDEDVKQNMFSVLLSIEQTVDGLLKNTPLTPPSMGEYPHSDSNIVPSRGQRSETSRGVKINTPLNPPSKGEFKLPKKERIKSKKLIEAVFAEGKNLNNSPLKLIYLPSEFEGDTKFKVAVVAPKRNFKSAVHRNRIKRLLREAYRLNKALIFNNSERDFALVFLYLGKEMPDFQLIESKMIGLLKKFLKKIADEEAL